MTLSGTNNTFSGGLYVPDGTVILTNNEAVADGESLTIGNASAFSTIEPAAAIASAGPASAARAGAGARHAGGFGRHACRRRDIPVHAAEVTIMRNRAFTLVELLVVIAIIGILIGLLLPAINAARESGRRFQCSNNQKQLGLGFVNYEAALGVFPPGRSGYDDSGAPANTTCAGRSGTSGFVYILPYIELNDIYKTFMPFANGAPFPTCSDATTTGWETPQIATVLQRRPGTFVCPSDMSQPTYNGYPTSSYALMMGTYGPGPPYGYTETAKQENTGMFVYLHPRKAQQVKDGLSHTIFLGETMVSDAEASSNYWAHAVRFQMSMRSSYNPINTPPGQGATSTDANGISFNGAFGSRHSAGANFCFGDGHVVFIPDNIDMPTYQAMSTIAGGENLMYSP